jgi:hypothetical protein
VTTAKPLEERYFSWLYSKVRATRDGAPGMSYTEVCSSMHRVKFDWHIPNDDNRAADGRELRVDFLNKEEHRDPNERDKEWLELDASVFEVLVALCLRANFMIDIPVELFFEMFLVNLNLQGCVDTGKKQTGKINRVIKKLNERQYSQNGQGGLFPLQNPPSDQRRVELWYQMSAYMTENHMY